MIKSTLALIATALLIPSLSFTSPLAASEADDQYLEEVILPIVQSTCLGCHNSQVAAGGHSFETAEEVKSHASLILDAVSNGRMPKGRMEWRDSEDGQTLLDWAASVDAGDHH